MWTTTERDAWLGPARDEMTDDQLDLRTVHPVWGEVDLAGLFRIIAIHDSLHRKDVETLKAADTPTEA